MTRKSQAIIKLECMLIQGCKIRLATNGNHHLLHDLCQVHKTIASIWHKKYARIFTICSKKQTAFQECSSRKTVIMSKDKCPSTFLHQMEAIVFIILQIFLQQGQFWKLGNIIQIFPSFSWGIFSHATRLDQSCTSENIWRIVTLDICLVSFTCYVVYLDSW